MATPELVGDPGLERLELELRAAFAVFISAFGEAQAAGLDAPAIIAADLREAMGESFHDLPPMMRMMLG
jgi:hypothetical protein